MVETIIGTIIDEKFRVTRLLGEGAFGNVFLADDLRLGRTVAVKMLGNRAAAYSIDRVRFEREAQALSRLSHPHVVQVYSFGFSQDRPYIAMQHLQGETLADVLAREKCLVEQRTCRIGLQICQALAAAHVQGIIHRDLKPENVMLLPEDPGDFVKVVDFGLAALDAPITQRLTQTGAIIGTVEYMSPEICKGMKTDARSDVYSLGCMLYKCLSGKPPLEGPDDLAVLFRHATELPPRLSELADVAPINPNLEKVIFKAIQKEPESRFQSMDEFAEALAMVLQGSPLAGRVSAVRLRSPLGKRTRSAVAFMGAGAIIVVIGAATFFALRSHKQGDGTLNAQHTNEPLQMARMIESLSSESVDSNARLDSSDRMERDRAIRAARTRIEQLARDRKVSEAIRITEETLEAIPKVDEESRHLMDLNMSLVDMLDVSMRWADAKNAVKQADFWAAKAGQTMILFSAVHVFYVTCDDQGTIEHADPFLQREFPRGYAPVAKAWKAEALFFLANQYAEKTDPVSMSNYRELLLKAHKEADTKYVPSHSSRLIVDTAYRMMRLTQAETASLLKAVGTESGGDSLRTILADVKQNAGFPTSPMEWARWFALSAEVKQTDGHLVEAKSDAAKALANVKALSSLPCDQRWGRYIRARLSRLGLT